MLHVMELSILAAIHKSVNLHCFNVSASGMLSGQVHNLAANRCCRPSALLGLLLKDNSIYIADAEVSLKGCLLRC